MRMLIFSGMALIVWQSTHNSCPLPLVVVGFGGDQGCPKASHMLSLGHGDCMLQPAQTPEGRVGLD